MKYKKSLFLIICIISVMILFSGCGVRSKKSGVFQSEEVSEIINGVWKTGDTEFDFIVLLKMTRLI